VSYIVQRAESLAAMFYLVAVLLFAASRSGRIGIGGGVLGAALLAVGFLGIISKETVASLPAALILYWFCFLRDRRDQARPGWGSALFAALPALYGIYLARHFLLPGFGEESGQSSWMYIPSAGLGVEGVSPGRYLMTQFGVIVWYLRLFVLPTHLTFDYGWPFADSFWSAQVLPPLAVLLVLVALAVWAFPRYRWATFAIGWLFVTLAPSSSIIPIKDAAFEYRMYLPMYGLTVLVVVGGFDAIKRFSASRSAARSAERIALAAAPLWIAALGFGTAARNETLQDPLALARDSAAKAPDNWRNQFGLGAALVEAGKTEEAVAPFERSIALNPEQGTSRIMLGDIYARAGRLEEAETILLPATDVREESVAAGAYRQLGFLYKAQNYPTAAIAMFEQALARKPSWHSLELQIVRLLRYEGDFHAAAVRLNHLTREVPSYAGSLSREIAQTNLLGGVQSFELGEPDFARNMLSIAMGDPKTFPAAAHYLAYVESRVGNDTEALRLLIDLERRGLADSAALANLERARAGEDLAAPTTSDRLARR
jgi:tetratricopeptide (TPR) repeat protein